MATENPEVKKAAEAAFAGSKAPEKGAEGQQLAEKPLSELSPTEVHIELNRLRAKRTLGKEGLSDDEHRRMAALSYFSDVRNEKLATEWADLVLKGKHESKRGKILTKLRDGAGSIAEARRLVEEEMEESGMSAFTGEDEDFEDEDDERIQSFDKVVGR